MSLQQVGNVLPQQVHHRLREGLEEESKNTQAVYGDVDFPVGDEVVNC